MFKYFFPILFCFSLLLFISSKELKAQSLSSNEADQNRNKQMQIINFDSGKEGNVPSIGLKRLRNDLKYLFSTPSRFDKDDMPEMLLFIGTIAALYAERKDIREFVLRNKTEARQQIYDYARASGKGAFAPGLSLIFFASGKVVGEEYHVETAQIILESYAASAFAAGFGSFILSTERPRDGDNINFFQSGGHGISLDIALASSFVFPITDRYLTVHKKDSVSKKILKYVARVFIFSLPILTALQRMSSDSHWAPDVFLGGVAGLTIGKILSQAHQSIESEKLSFSISGGMIKIQF